MSVWRGGLLSGLEERIKLARGAGEVDLLLTNCRLVNVLLGTIHPASIAVAGDTIVGIDGEYSARETVDIGGRYVAPGFADAHVHLESSMVSVPGFAEAVVPRGVTTVFTDCHEIANVMGLEGIRYMIESATGLPIDVFIMLPPCVPATPLETSGAVLEAGDLELMTGEPGVIGLGELMNFPGTIAGDPRILAKLALFPGGPVDGHAPGLSGNDLSAYIAAGPESDHECTTVEEATEKLQKGMYVFMREGTGARNLLDLLPVLNSENSSRLCLCTDDRHPADLLQRGSIDSLITMAIGAGISTVTAIQMATINTARRFELRARGAVAVGYRADMVVVSDLASMSVDMVFKDGRLVAEGGELISTAGKGASIPPSSFDVAGFSKDRLRIPASAGKARVIGLVPDQIVTQSLLLDAPSEKGDAVPDTGQDILKLAVVERHSGTGNVGLGFVRGFGLERGAMASSVAHDSHNIVVAGTSDEDMAAAVEKVIEMGGGQVVVAAGEVRASVSLPVAGLMSPLPLSDVAIEVEKLQKAAADLGCRVTDPFMTMGFLALPVIPELKLTDRGLVDVGRFEIVPLFTD
ncbi:MAG: adenine deaminase [Actinobacteria bacterium]|nr:adenine deaminase [Actinomycetota bacterium]